MKPKFVIWMAVVNPYKNLKDKHFWRTAIAQRNMLEIEQLWTPKFEIGPADKVATFGSCFAQHFGKSLRSRGYNWLNTEPAPEGLSREDCRSFNYDAFTCRTGNIYTTSLLNQWVEWALGTASPPKECWEENGRYYDPFRPRIEPDGFVSAEEMFRSRQQATSSFREAIETADVFVFTLGLTESWFNSEHGYEYPMCPGTAAGEFDSDKHTFRNQPYPQVIKSLRTAIESMLSVNSELRFLLTVSPVPLTATKSGQHVLVATTMAKSILRAVAGQSARKPLIDYFPSYEIISSAPFRGTFYEANQRNVSRAGVGFVMDSFFNCLDERPAQVGQSQRTAESHSKEEDVACEEALLEAYGK